MYIYIYLYMYIAEISSVCIIHRNRCRNELLFIFFFFSNYVFCYNIDYIILLQRTQWEKRDRATWMPYATILHLSFYSILFLPRSPPPLVCEIILSSFSSSSFHLINHPWIPIRLTAHTFTRSNSLVSFVFSWVLVVGPRGPLNQ